MSINVKYTNVAILLHWLIALAIILQLASGIWMVGAIKDDESRKLAYEFYQYHKAVGIIVLVLSIFRLFWRLTHKAPALPDRMKRWEIFAAHASHYGFYFLMISVPLLGWAMVSSSSYGFPTMIFGLFEWPHISFLVGKTDLNSFFTAYHKYLAFLTLFLLFLHIGAALKHQFIDKDNLINRMIPGK